MTIAAFAAAAGFASYIYWPEDDIVINPNITESYRSSLEDEREEYINELLENSSDPDLYIKKGVVEKKLGLLSEAERSIEKVFDFKIDKETAGIAYLYLARVYRDMGKYDDADNKLRMSTEVNPQNAAAFLELIDLYKKHYPAKADELDIIYQAAADFSNSSKIWASYAQFLEDRRQYRDAWIYWQEVVLAEPENVEAIEHVQNLAEILGIY